MQPNKARHYAKRMSFLADFVERATNNIAKSGLTLGQLAYAPDFNITLNMPGDGLLSWDNLKAFQTSASDFGQEISATLQGKNRNAFMFSFNDQKYSKQDLNRYIDSMTSNFKRFDAADGKQDDWIDLKKPKVKTAMQRYFEEQPETS
jgi:hypothetical protein